MNDYMTERFHILETFIDEAEQESSGLSAQNARQALDILRDEIGSLATLQDTLSVIEQETIETISLDTSVLRQYVTRISMKSRGLLIRSFQGKTLSLLARPPSHDNVDETILLGSGIDEPLGIVSGPGTITVSKTSSDLCVFDLACMLEHLAPVAHARWVVNSRVFPLMASFRDPEGRNLLVEEHAPTFWGFPIVQVDDQMCGKYGFEVALIDLRYYVWGEYEVDNGILVDGMPGVSEPFYSEDGMGYSGPFVVLGKVE